MVWLMPLASFLILFVAGLVAVRHRHDWIVWTFLAVAGLSMVWALMKGNQAQGWDGIGYAIFALLLAAPAMLGVLIGGGVGWWRRRRDRTGLE